MAFTSKRAAYLLLIKTQPQQDAQECQVTAYVWVHMLNDWKAMTSKPLPRQQSLITRCSCGRWLGLHNSVLLQDPLAKAVRDPRGVCSYREIGRHPFPSKKDEMKP